MNYSALLDIAAIFVSVILAVDIIHKHQFHRTDSRYFLACVLSVAGLAFFDWHAFMGTIVSGMQNMVVVIIVAIAFTFKAITPVFFSLFIFSYHSKRLSGQNKYMAAAFTTGAVGVAFVIYFLARFITNPHEMTNASLRQLSVSTSIVLLLQIIIVVVFVERHKKLFLTDEFKAMIGAAFIAGGAFILVVFKPQLITIPWTCAVICLLCYIVMENPSFYIDKLTGVNNIDSLTQVIASKDRSKDKFVAIFVVIDAIDSVNMSSQQLIRSVSRYLKRELFDLRSVFRISDTEFVVLWDGTINDIKPYIDMLNAKFDEGFDTMEGATVSLGKSILVCEYPNHFSHFSSMMEMRTYLSDELINSSDTTDVCYATDELVEKRRRADEVEKALRKAIKDETLVVQFQPIYDAVEKKIVSLEALSRIIDPTLGFIPPDEFIPIAEHTGLIAPMGRLVLKKSCKFIKDYLLKLPNNTVRTIEINLSPIQLMYKEELEAFMKIILEEGVPQNMISFEVTESATADSPNAVKSAMLYLIDNGTKFALDDYGTGYSNINYLANFPFEYIKFDKELIWSFFKNKSANVIMSKEFEIIHLLKKEVIAEGIEEKEYIDELSSKGVRYYQGYYFAKAMSETQCLDYLQNPTPTEMFVRATQE